MPLTTLPLNVTRRCALAIVACAQEYNPNIKAMEGAKQGMVADIEQNEFFKLVKPYDMVLCRTNAECMAFALSLIEREKPVSILGKDIGQNVIKHLDRIVEQSKCFTPLDLLNWILEQEAKLAEKESGGNEKRFQNDDDMLILQLLLKTSTSLENVKTKVNALFSDSIVNRIIVSTVHKSKGLEADTVFVNFQYLPHPKALEYGNEETIIQETVNLPYVAITRAKDTLYKMHIDIKEMISTI